MKRNKLWYLIFRSSLIGVSALAYRWYLPCKVGVRTKLEPRRKHWYVVRTYCELASLSPCPQHPICFGKMFLIPHLHIKVRKSLNKESGNMGSNPRWAPQANLVSNMPSLSSSLLVCKAKELDFNNASGQKYIKTKQVFIYF